MTAYLLFLPTQWMRNTVKLIAFPLYYKVRIVMYSLGHLAISYCWEMMLIVSPTRRLIKKFTLLNLLLLCNRILKVLKIPSPLFLLVLIENEQTKLKVYKQLATFKMVYQTSHMEE